MNRNHMTYLVALLLGISVLLFATRHVFLRRHVADHLLRLSDAGDVADDTLPSVADTLSSPEAPGIQPTGTLGAVNASGGSVPIAFASSLPTGVVYRSAAAVEGVAEVAHILETVSNAVTAVDGILKARNYRVVTQFDRPVWLEATDKAQATVWQVTPYRTTSMVGTIRAVVYRSSEMTEEDKHRGFELSLYPDTGHLRRFRRSDSREVLLAHSNGVPRSFATQVNGGKWREMRWNENGELVRNQVIDWASRGFDLDPR